MLKKYANLDQYLQSRIDMTTPNEKSVLKGKNWTVKGVGYQLWTAQSLYKDTRLY